MHSARGDPYGPGCPIRKSQDHGSVTSSPGLIAGSNVLHRLSTPRHPPCALRRLITPTGRRGQPAPTVPSSRIAPDMGLATRLPSVGSTSPSGTALLCIISSPIPRPAGQTGRVSRVGIDATRHRPIVNEPEHLPVHPVGLPAKPRKAPRRPVWGRGDTSPQPTSVKPFRHLPFTPSTLSTSHPPPGPSFSGAGSSPPGTGRSFSSRPGTVGSGSDRP